MNAGISTKEDQTTKQCLIKHACKILYSAKTKSVYRIALIFRGSKFLRIAVF